MAVSIATMSSSSAVAKLPLTSGNRTLFTRRVASVRVRCQAEDKPSQTEQPLPSSQSSPSPSPAPSPAPAAATIPAKASTRFSDVLAFAGPAPERINGRLAMVGFVSALGVELARGTGLAAQLADGSGLQWFVATASVLTAASLVPLFKGVTAESRSGGVMTSDAEMWNGRFAMLGLVALAFTEFVTGSPLV